jgi:nucleoside-diphosphate-sugar epimerase
MVKALVTGGGGFLGSAIVRLLIEKGYSVRSLARQRYLGLDDLGADQVQGDIRDSAAVANACRGVDVVFHTAAKAGVWGSRASFESINVTGTHHVIEACREQAVTYLVYTSSPSVVFDGGDHGPIEESAPYPDTYLAHYPATKAAAEQMVRTAAGASLHTVCLRPHLIWGPGDPHLVPRILNRDQRLRRIGDGSNLVDTTYIDNAAHAHLLAYERIVQNPTLSGRVYFIANDEPMPLWEMIDAILAAGGKSPVRKAISSKRACQLGALLEWIYGRLGVRSEPPMTRFVAAELSTSHYFDLSAARHDLGYRPLVSVADGLKHLAQSLSSQIK